ncbi:GH25 family lysozyme [Lactococcus ileimucosae]|uniref:GH25 family lysozyme n=1 Tax=Lactococcus ileimucosae TaxID=2941329 RepID=UPI002044BE7A|nr:GH25 family lysozyme [Lactococcus ileimucosae]
MINIKKAAVLTGICFSILAAHSVKAEIAEVPVDNHPMGYYAEVQTAENPMAAPLDAQGNLAAVDEDGQTVKEELSEETDIPKNASRFRRSVARESEQTNLRNAPSDLVSNDASLPRKDAVDIASWQSWMTQSDFNQLKAQGVKTVIVKLTESTNYVNPYAKSHIQMAQRAGLVIAVYHFSHFSESGRTAQATVNNTARAEANFFASIAKQYGLPASTIMINDAEYVPAGSVGSMPYWDWTIASQNFADQLKKQGFATTRHYTSKAWAVDGTGQMEPKKLGAKNLWIAQYLYGKPSASNLQNTQFGAWQYTSQMYFTNFSKRSPLDVSIDYANIFSSGELPRISVKFAHLPVKNPGSSPFKDISHSIYKNYINWNYSVGITTGYTPTTYNPDANVTRGEMSVFLHRLAGAPGYTPPFNVYTDINQYKNQILWLTAANISNGTIPHYNPNGNVTRGQMAAFLHRTAKAMGKAPASGTYNSPFTDINGNMFKNDINWLKSKGITTGYTPTTFRPDASITRGEMAAFINRFYNTLR